MSYQAIHPTAPLARLGRPFQIFLRSQLSGAVLLMTATVCALAAANSGWSAWYFQTLQTPATVALGPWSLSKPLLLWINDGLMGVFFFVVGLEIKREMLVGELASARRAALPLAGAVGGMAVPAAIFLAFTWGTAAARFYFCIGLLVWLSFLKSGVHATIAAVLMAFTIPARTRLDGRPFVEQVEALLKTLKDTGLPTGRRLLSPAQDHVLYQVGMRVNEASAPLQRLEHYLVPLANRVVLPLFALANAGVAIDMSRASTLTSGLGIGLVAGLFVGKQAGIAGASWVAVRLGLAQLPSGVSWRQLYGVAVLGGIGFTMSLFVSALAFADFDMRASAKLSILVASLLSAVTGTLLLLSSNHSRAAGDREYGP